MKLHVLGVPGTPTTDKVRTNYFCYDAWKFIRHLKDQYDIVHYGCEGSDVPCQHVDLPADPVEWNEEARRAIHRFKNPHDVILCFYGVENQQATKGHEDCYIIEPHIGYDPNAVFAPYRVFVSYAQLHYYYGLHRNIGNLSWWDTVIPNAIDIDEFEFKEEKKDYVLMLGRVIESKGVHLAIQATKKAGKKLVIAGDTGETRTLKYMGYDKTPAHVELVGNVNVDQRRKLLSEAECLIAPTHYMETFGMMVVEAHASGTPTITTDWGGFIDNNPHGITGYRGRLFKDFVWALHNIGNIDKKAIHKRAHELYSDAAVYPQFHDYIQRVLSNDFYAE